MNDFEETLRQREKEHHLRQVTIEAEAMKRAIDRLEAIKGLAREHGATEREIGEAQLDAR